MIHRNHSVIQIRQTHTQRYPRNPQTQQNMYDSTNKTYSQPFVITSHHSHPSLLSASQHLFMAFQPLFSSTADLVAILSVQHSRQKFNKTHTHRQHPSLISSPSPMGQNTQQIKCSHQPPSHMENTRSQKI